MADLRSGIVEKSPACAATWYDSCVICYAFFCFCYLSSLVLKTQFSDTRRRLPNRFSELRRDVERKDRRMEGSGAIL